MCCFIDSVRNTDRVQEDGLLFLFIKVVFIFMNVIPGTSLLQRNSPGEGASLTPAGGGKPPWTANLGDASCAVRSSKKKAVALQLTVSQPCLGQQLKPLQCMSG